MAKTVQVEIHGKKFSINFMSNNDLSDTRHLKRAILKRTETNTTLRELMKGWSIKAFESESVEHPGTWEVLDDASVVRPNARLLCILSKLDAPDLDTVKKETDWVTLSDSDSPEDGPQENNDATPSTSGQQETPDASPTHQKVASSRYDIPESFGPELDKKLKEWSPLTDSERKKVLGKVAVSVYKTNKQPSPKELTQLLCKRYPSMAECYGSREVSEMKLRSSFASRFSSMRKKANIPVARKGVGQAKKTPGMLSSSKPEQQRNFASRIAESTLTEDLLSRYIMGLPAFPTNLPTGDYTH